MKLLEIAVVLEIKFKFKLLMFVVFCDIKEFIFENKFVDCVDAEFNDKFIWLISLSKFVNPLITSIRFDFVLIE